MSTHDDTSDLPERLRSLGEAHVPGPLQAAHLSAIAEAAPARRTRGFWTRARVGLAFFAGLLIGGSGLATAGALPGEAQDVAHDVFGAVGIGVPERNQDDCEVPGPYANHGEYVSGAARGEVEGVTAGDAARSECGKPVGAGGSGPDAGPRGADNPCRPPWAGGKPPWAGPGTAEEKAAAKADAMAGFDRPAECDDEAGGLEVEPAEEVEGAETNGASEPGPPAAAAEPADPGDPAEPAEPAEPAGPSADSADPVDPPADADDPDASADADDPDAPAGPAEDPPPGE